MTSVRWPRCSYTASFHDRGRTALAHVGTEQPEQARRGRLPLRPGAPERPRRSRRPEIGAPLAALSGLALIGLMFTTWYRPVSAGVGSLFRGAGKQAPATPQSAWEAYAAIDLLLVVLALGAAALLVLMHMGRAAGLRVAASATLAAFGTVMALVVLYRMIDPPADVAVIRLAPSAYLGLLATAGVALGGLLALREARPAVRRPEPEPAARDRPSAPASTAPARSSPLGRPPQRRWLWVGAAGLLAVYLATRLLFIDRFPYFFDEGTYAFFTERSSSSLHDLFISFTIGREPLPIWLGIPFVKLGVNPLSAVRLASVACGLATVVVVGLLGRRLGGTAVGFVAAALTVVLPFFVVHHGIGITEPLVVLVMASALLLQVELARRPELRVAALLGLVLAAGVLTKENTRPALALLPLSLLCFDWAVPDRRARLLTWVRGVAIAVAMVICAELVLRSSSRYDELLAARDSQYYTVRSLRDALAQPGAWWQTSWPVYRPALTGYVTIPLLVAGLAGTALGLLGRHRRLTLLLLGWIALPFAIAVLFTTLPFPRHVMYLIPPALVLMAYGIVEGARAVAKRLPGRAGALAIAAAALLLLLPGLRLDARVLADPATARYPSRDDEQYVTGTTGGAVWPGVADAIRRRASGSEVVVLHPAADDNVLQFLLGADSPYVFAQGGTRLAPRAQLAVYDQNTGPFVDVLAHRLSQRRGFVPLERFERPRDGAVVTLYGRPPAGRPAFTLAGDSIRSAAGEVLRIVPRAVRGYVELARATDGRARSRGWAANLRRRRPAAFLLAFAGRRFVAAAPLTVDRPELASRAPGAVLQRSGYEFEAPLTRLGRQAKPAALRIYAVDGKLASPLPFRCDRPQDFGCGG